VTRYFFDASSAGSGAIHNASPSTPLISMTLKVQDFPYKGTEITSSTAIGVPIMMPLM